jgi:diguanylate cyclase (GGDEF)-like protein
LDSQETRIVGTAIQVTGAGLIGILCYLIGRTIRHPFLRYWSAGWASLTVALFALLVAFLRPASSPMTYRVYCLGEYVAGYLWLAGCRHFTHGARLTARQGWLVAPAAMLASFLPWFFTDLNGILSVHALVMAGLFAASCAVLCRARAERVRGTGPVVMAVALALLAVEFLQYAVLCGYSYHTSGSIGFPHLRYGVFFDLLLLVVLGFGMEMVALEAVRRELEAANRELRNVGSKWRDQAQRDPLTDALNRHAFDALQVERAAAGTPCAGCVAVLDLDNLKPINDTLGHAAGDQALQLTARAIRALIRPDDLLFRWGGDEFLILWLGMKEPDAAARLTGLDDGVARQVALAGLTFPVPPSVSHGVAGFDDSGELSAAIDRADRQMYASKSARRAARKAAATG